MPNIDWMQALAAHYRTACSTQTAPLLLLCDIDDTLLDTRFMIRAVLQTGDAERGTRYFADLELDEIWMAESRLAELLALRGVPQAEQAAVLSSYAQHAWSAPALRHWQTALPGAMQMVAWFQQQPRTSVALVTGRSAWMRAEPPFDSDFTCSTVAIVVSPGKVVISAPCDQPRFTDSCSEAPESRP